MRVKSTLFSLIGVMLCTQLSITAPPPGFMKTYYAYGHVYDQDNNPEPGVEIKFLVTCNNGSSPFTDWAYGTTDSNGWFYLTIQIDYWMYPYLSYMSASVDDDRYTTLSSQNNFSRIGSEICPAFVVIHDEDGNLIKDEWELPLAKKFCPNLTLHSGDNGVRPVPVEIMDRNYDYVIDWRDVIVDVYTISGDPIGSFSPSQIYYPTVIYKDIYPYYHPEMVNSTWIDTNNDGCFSCSGDGIAPGNRILHTHLEWGALGNTNPSSWYTHWNYKIAQHSSDMRYTKGTTYAHLFKDGSDIVIQYWFFYPFNACANRHEGDWEHINVVINSQIPSQAQMSKIVYYYHHEKIGKYPSQITIVDQTHPKVYVGGYVSSFGMSGHGSHGSYWRSGVQEDINSVGSDETVDGQGLTIDFDSYSNIIILPRFNHVNNGNNNITPYIDMYGNNLNWMVYNAFWGHVMSEPSAGQTTFSGLRGILGTLTFGIGIEVGERWFELPENVGNVAPAGPVQHAEWEDNEY